MNAELAKARAAFRSQKGSIQSGYDNSPIPEGQYNAMITKATIITRKIKGEECPVFQLVVKIDAPGHEADKRTAFPFSPILNEPDGIIQAGKYCATVLGFDNVPGKTSGNGEFVLDMGEFLGKIEDLATEMVGVAISITVKNGKKTRDDGTPYQSVYINRALGEDVKGNAPSADKGDDTKPSTIAKAGAKKALAFKKK